MVTIELILLQYNLEMSDLRKEWIKSKYTFWTRRQLAGCTSMGVVEYSFQLQQC